MAKRRSARLSAERDFFAGLEPAVKSAIKETLKQCAETVVKVAQSKCPVDTGKLRDSIHKEDVSAGNMLQYRVVSDAKASDGTYYGKIVEFSPKINKPYLYPALDQEIQPTINKIAESFRKASESIGK